MILVALTLMLSAAPAPDLKVASAGFQAVGADEKKVAFFSDYFAQRLGEAGKFPVTTPSQMATLLGLERQKQLLNCADESASCLAELAGALGADAVLSGSVARVGGSMAITVKITATRDARELASAAATLGREEDVLEWLSERASEFGPRVRKALRPPETSAVVQTEAPGPSSSSGPRLRVWVPAVAGLVLLGGSVFLQSKAASRHWDMIGEDSGAKRREIASDGSSYQTAAAACGAAGIAAIGLAVFMGVSPG